MTKERPSGWAEGAEADTLHPLAEGGHTERTGAKGQKHRSNDR